MQKKQVLFWKFHPVSTKKPSSKTMELLVDLLVDAKKNIKVTPMGSSHPQLPQKRLEELRVRELEVEQSMRSEQQRKTYLEEEAQQVIEGTGRV